MSTATRSEAAAAPVAAEPDRKSASQARGLTARVLRMQRAAGNHAVAQTVARSPARSIQRCGANCSCNSCSGGHGHDEEMLDEELGAGLLRSAVATRSG
jgi:hypothetical protein